MLRGKILATIILISDVLKTKMENTDAFPDQNKKVNKKPINFDFMYEQDNKLASELLNFMPDKHRGS